MCRAFAAMSIGSSDQQCFPDTGATNHMTADAQSLGSRTEYLGNDHIVVGNGSQLPITHTGTTTIHTPFSSIPLRNDVPDIKKNLLSVAQLTRDLDCVFVFHSSGFVIKDRLSGRILHAGPSEGGPIAAGRANTPTGYSQGLFNTKASGDVWHMRLGHPHPKRLSSLVKNNCFLLSGSISFKKISVQVVLPGSLLNNRLVYQTDVLLMLLLLFTRIFGDQPLLFQIMDIAFIYFLWMTTLDSHGYIHCIGKVKCYLVLNILRVWLKVH